MIGSDQMEILLFFKEIAVLFIFLQSKFLIRQFF